MFADTTVERSCDTASNCRVVVKNVAGLVQVQAWDQNRVEVKGTLGDGVTRFDFSGGGQLVTMEVVVPRLHVRRIESQLSISVPAGAALDVEAVSADVRINEVEGEINATTVSGDLAAHNAVRAVRATSVSGNVEVSANGSSVTAKTASGDLRVSGTMDSVQADSVSGSVEVKGSARRVALETISGDATVTGTMAEVKAKTVSGDVQVNRASEQADASSVSGDISVDGGPLVSASFSTESGDVKFSGELAESGKLRAFARSGNIVVRVPEGTPAAFDASTFSGNIRNAFGPAPEKGHGPETRLQFGPADARALLSLETMSGNITLEKK